MDARHLRQRVADLLRQSGDRVDPGCAAHRDRRDRGPDHAEEPGAHGRHRLAGARGQDVEGGPTGRRRAGRAGRAGARPAEGADAIDQVARRAPLDARRPLPLYGRVDHGRRFAHHPLRHAGIPLRRGHEPGLSQRQGLLPARLEHHAAPVLRGPALPGLALARGLGPQAPRRTAQEDALELLPLLHRPGARSLAGHLRRSRAVDPERVLRLDRRAGLVPRATRGPTTRPR